MSLRMSSYKTCKYRIDVDKIINANKTLWTIHVPVELTDTSETF